MMTENGRKGFKMDFIQIFALAFTLEAGYLDDYTRADGVEFIQYDSYYSETNFRIEALDLFFVGWGNKVTFQDTDSVYYLPVTETYTVEAGIKYGGFEVGVMHLCAHPVSSIVMDEVTIIDPLNTSFNRLYVKYSGKIGGKQ